MGGGGMVGIGGTGSGMHKGSSIITQKATVHHVSKYVALFCSTCI